MFKSQGELFDMEAFVQHYGNMSLDQLHTARNHILDRISEYKSEDQNGLDCKHLLKYRDAYQDAKVELALIGKLIFRKYDEDFFECPACGLLCEMEEKVCRKCGSILASEKEN